MIDPKGRELSFLDGMTIPFADELSNSRTRMRYLNRFVGRDEELGWLETSVERGERLITLFGAPGVGKTRLAVEMLEVAKRRSRDTFFCDLSSARTEDEAAEIVLSVITQKRGRAHGDVANAVVAALDACETALVVLDNFEQLVTVASSAVATWVAQCERAAFIVTSREVLRISGELAREVLPLALPSSPADVQEAPAGRMLLEAMSRYRSAMDAEGPTAQRLWDVLARLEGIPLAIEIVAPRIALLGLPLVEQQLFSVLTSKVHVPRATTRATRTLHEAIAWSWDLLSDDERRTLAQSAVFRGGFTLEAMSAVLAPSENHETLDLLSTLRDKSLIRQLQGDNEAAPRFGLYAAVAHFADEQMDALGLRRSAEERHREYFEVFADRVARSEASAIASIDDETDNIVIALERCVALGTLGDENAARQARSFLLVLPLLSRLSLDRRLMFFDAASKISPSTNDLSSAALTLAHAELLSYAARGQDALVELQRALDLARAEHARPLEARILARLGFALVDADPERAMVPLEEAARIAHAIRDSVTEARVLGALGFACAAAGDDQTPLELSVKELRAAQASGSLKHQVNARLHAATASIACHDAKAAIAHLRPALEKASQVRPSVEAFALWSLGMARHVDGDLEKAERAYRDALAKHLTQLLPYYAALVRGSLALLLLEQERMAEVIAELDRLEPEFANHRANAVLVPAMRSIAEAALDGHPIDLTFLVHNAGPQRGLVLRLWMLADAQGCPGFETAPKSHAVETALIDSAIARKKPPRNVETGSRDKLLIHVRGSWFVPPNGAIVDCHGRQAIRYLLVGLANHRQQAPGMPLTIDELRQIGWPDESMAAESARARLRQTLSVLRKLGLGKIIVWRDGGYLLSERVDVEFRE